VRRLHGRGAKLEGAQRHDDPAGTSGVMMLKGGVAAIENAEKGGEDAEVACDA